MGRRSCLFNRLEFCLGRLLHFAFCDCFLLASFGFSFSQDTNLFFLNSRLLWSLLSIFLLSQATLRTHRARDGRSRTRHKGIGELAFSVVFKLNCCFLIPAHELTVGRSLMRNVESLESWSRLFLSKLPSDTRKTLAEFELLPYPYAFSLALYLSFEVEKYGKNSSCVLISSLLTSTIYNVFAIL